MSRYHVLGDWAAADQVFLEDALQNFGGAGPVPDALGIDDGDGALTTDLQTVRLGAVDAPRSHEVEFHEPALQEIPGFEGDSVAR